MIYNNYYVYFLIDPRNDMPFYVGKGTGDRAYSHLIGKDGCKNTHKDRKINKIRSTNQEPQVYFVKQNLYENEAYSLEKKLIEFYGRQNRDLFGILTNICTDANPLSAAGKIGYRKGKKQPDRMIEKRRLTCLGKRKGTKHSEETKEKIRQKRKTQIFSEDHYKKLSIKFSGEGNPFYGKKHSDESKIKCGLKNINRIPSEDSISKGLHTKSKQIYTQEKPVINIDTKEIFKSIGEANKSITKGDILKSIKTGQRADGYRWAYFDKELFTLWFETLCAA